MNFYAYLSFNAFVVSAVMAHIVLRGSNDRTSRMFGLLSLTIAAFAFTEFQLRIAGDYGMADFWLKVYTLWPFAVALALNFALVFTESTDFLRRKISYVLIYGPAFILSSFGLFMDEFIGRPMEVYWGWTYESMGDPVIAAVVPLWATLMSVLALYLCLGYYLEQKDRNKRGQAKFVTIGLIAPIALGSLSSVAQLFAGSRFPEMLITSFTFGNFFIAYGISRYGLFRIDPATAAGNITRNMSDSMFLLDGKGNIVKVNTAACSLAGRKEGRLVGRPMSDILIRPDGKALGRDWYRRLLRKGAEKGLDASVRTSSKTPVPVSFTSSVIRDGSGSVQGLVLLGRDVTERRKAEEKERKYFHDMALLSQMTVEYADLPMDIDIFEFIGDKISEQIGKGYVFMLVYNEKDDVMVVKSAHGIDERARKALKFISKDIIGMEFPLTDETRFTGERPYLKRLEGDLSSLTSGIIPRPVIAAGTRMIGIKGVHEMGIINEGRQFGSIVILTNKKAELENLELLEAMINQASVAIQRRRVQEALIESEKKYATVVEQSNDSVIIIKDSKVKFMNSAALAYTQKSEAEILDTDFLDFVAPEYREMLVERYMRRIVGEDIPNRYEIEMIADDKRWPVEVSANLIDFMGGPAILAILRDMSERKEAEKAIRESEDRYRALFDGSMDAVYIADFDGRFVDANRAALDLTGFSTEEITSVNFASLLDEDQLPLALQTLEDLVRTGFQPEPVEFRLKRKDGELIWIEVMSSIVVKDGAPVAILGIARDITTRKTAEAAMRESEEKYRTLVERSHDGVYIQSAKGFVFVNKRVCEITEYDADELIGMTLVDLIHPDDREIIAEITSSRMEGRSAPHTYEARLTTRRGKVRYCEFSVSDIVYEGRRAELGAIRDITLRRKVESDVQEYAKALERSNRELEQFAYVASHDLQEPLRMVASYVQLLERRYKGKLDSDADEFIEYAVDGAKRMQVLINDLLQYSRVQTKGKPFEPLELGKVLDIALSNLKIAIEESSARVTSDDLPTVSADPTQLAQLLQNLIANAIKFRGENVPEIHVGVEQKDRFWQISIADNGIGIDPEYRDRIFVIFQRLHAREDYEGTGIGLAVCKRIVERHGGEIWMESELAEGATFYFTLPIHRSDRE